jgi:hypothetical protein
VADDFDVGAMPGPGRHSAAAERLAETISVTMGEHYPAIDEYVMLLGYAPVEHLKGLAKRGARIYFAPTVAHYLLSADADYRRGERGHCSLSASERAAVIDEYGPSSGVIAVYDPPSDALVLPYLIAGPDKLRAVLHELGHAMTYHQLYGREAEFARVLGELPTRIRSHLQAGYATEVGVRIHESFAEAYAMLIAGRVEELGMIASDLVGILNAVHEPQEVTKMPSWKMDPTTGRTASLAEPGTVETLGPIPDLEEPLPVAPTRQTRKAVRPQAA